MSTRVYNTTMMITCSTVGCKNIPTKTTKGLPFCNYCFDKLMDAGMVTYPVTALVLESFEYKKGS